MTKGKPWPTDDEKSLRNWINSGITLDVIAFSFDGKYSKNAIYQKAIDLGLNIEKLNQQTKYTQTQQTTKTEEKTKETKEKETTATAKAIAGEEEEEELHTGTSSSFKEDELSNELPSVEEALKKLNIALQTLESPGLTRAEILRLRSVISGVKVYQELFANYMDYKGLENELFEVRKKIAELTKKKSTQSAPA